MPSFQAKPVPSGLSMADVFHDAHVDVILEETLQSARARARKVLQEGLPNHLRKLQKLLADSDSESSALWLGHLDRGMFLAENVHLAGVTNRAVNGRDNLTDASSHTTTSSRGRRSARDLDDDLDNGSYWLGGLERNEVCLKMMRIVERETENSMILYLDLNHWLALEVPKIEDGNNFGVEVQDHIQRKIEGSYRTCTKFHSLSRSHFTDRMELARTWNRFPNLEDHAPAIAASDRYDFFLGLQAIKDLRDGAAELLHAMRENWAKIHDPKNSTGGGGVTMSGMY